MANYSSSETTIGAWIFVSHSHKDLERVREIRNYLELHGGNPLLFYLKCLDDDARLPELIEGEIRSREFFILCDSSNARKSQYVLQEMAEVLKKALKEQPYDCRDLASYLEALLQKLKSSSRQRHEIIDLNEEFARILDIAETLGGKVVEFIDLSQDLEPQLHKLRRLLKRATIFLSHAPSDREIGAMRIGDALRKHDYGVWVDAEMRPGEEWAAGIGVAIDEAVQHGFVLLLLSDASLKSEFCRRETLQALERAAASGRSNVVPVIVSQFDRRALPLELQSIQWFDLTTGPLDERVEELIRSLKTREME